MMAHATTESEKRKLTRRRWLRRALVYGSLAGVGLYTWRWEPHWVEVVHRALPIRFLPAELQGKTLVQISDLHIGPKVENEYLRRTLQSIKDLSPDMVVITGDFMTYSYPQQIDDVAVMMENLQKPPLGCYAILGNHDYGQDWDNTEVADTLTRRLGDAGITVLRNQIANVAGLQLIGIDDLWSVNYQAIKALAQLNREQACLAMCHNPDAQDLVEWQTYQGWVLAGHTHGGQCKPPFLRPPLLPVNNKRYTSGYFELGPLRHLYINRGLGYIQRVRFNCRPEITCFELTREV